MTLTSEQSNALHDILSFLNGNNQIFILRGYAGSGKTTMLKAVLEKLRASNNERPVCLFAPTGRAAKILQDKTGMGSTIHKGIYSKTSELIKYKEDEQFQLAVDMEDPTDKLIFKISRDMIGRQPIIIIDEASMISSKTNHDERFQFGTDNLLEDLITFADLNQGGQIIFIGDDAQLPPVGDSYSAVLSEEYFLKRGLTVASGKLTEVLRQGAGSLILGNAMKIRDALNVDRSARFGLSFDKATGEFSDTTPSEAIITCKRDLDETLFITYSNASAAQYNSAIRSIRFPDANGPVPGDRLLVVRNAYHLASADVDDCFMMFNGEFCDLLDVGNEESRFAFVGPDRIELRFRDVKVRHESGAILSVKIISSLLSSSAPNLTATESKALFSEFAARHQHLRRKEMHDQFLAELHGDPYFNALQVKYGYAITCHKAQDGEWPHVIVDFTGRSGLADEQLRWTYTALTRATRQLECVNYAKPSPLTNLDIKPVKLGWSPDAECHPVELDEVPDTPFHNSQTPSFLRQKYHEAILRLKDNERITSITSAPYRESYSITADNNLFRFDATYNGKGIFKPFTLVTRTTLPIASEILLRLNTHGRPEGRFTYTPSSPSLEFLFLFIKECVAQTDLLLTNVVEHSEQFYVTYSFFSTTYHRLQVYFKDNGQISTAIPMSPGPTPDASFTHLLSLISTQH